MITHILSQNDHISKRPHSYHHIIKLDTPLGNMKFTNKAKGKVKGLLTKQWVEIIVERVSIPKRIHSKTVIEETGQSKEVVDAVDSEETREEEEPQLTRRRQTGVIIGREAKRESDEENLDHSSKLKASKDDFILQQHPKGLGEGSGVTLEVTKGLIHKDPNEGSGVTLVVLDEPSGSSSSSTLESEDEIKDISSDMERAKADDTEKPDAKTTEIADANKGNDDKADEE
ncbi:hypothetical protein Tco_1310724 [Tanacetum coccineum]